MSTKFNSLALSLIGSATECLSVVSLPVGTKTNDKGIESPVSARFRLVGAISSEKALVERLSAMNDNPDLRDKVIPITLPKMEGTRLHFSVQPRYTPNALLRFLATSVEVPAALEWVKVADASRLLAANPSVDPAPPVVVPVPTKDDTKDVILSYLIDKGIVTPFAGNAMKKAELVALIPVA